MLTYAYFLTFKNWRNETITHFLIDFCQSREKGGRGELSLQFHSALILWRSDEDCLGENEEGFANLTIIAMNSGKLQTCRDSRGPGGNTLLAIIHPGN